MKNIFFIVLILIACDKNRLHPVFPSAPQNILDLNSPFDDFNASAPFSGETSPILFSTSKNSAGDNFDIAFNLLDVKFDREIGSLSFTKEENVNLDVYSINENLNEATSLINTTGNEWGPYLIARTLRGTGASKEQSYLILYSSDHSGDHQIYFTTNTSGQYTEAQPITFLNSNFDDAYPTLAQDSSFVLLSSNREGNWNIHGFALNETESIPTNLLAQELPPFSVANLNSSADERCPYTFGNILVFASNRPGGHGGFDLYYSVYTNRAWTEPVNLGPTINTEFNEYRPVLKNVSEFSNYLMIFSSDRPGGIGGYDLYFVGVEKVLFE